MDFSENKRSGSQGESSQAQFDRQGTSGSEMSRGPPLRSDTVEPGNFSIQEADAQKSSAKGRIGISIPPKTPGIFLRMAPEAQVTPVRAPRHSSVPLNAYQEYQDANENTSAVNTQGASLPAPVISANFSQKLRASMSRPTSPKDDPLPKGGLGSAMGSIESRAKHPLLAQSVTAGAGVSAMPPLAGKRYSAKPNVRLVGTGVPVTGPVRIVPGFDRNQHTTVFVSPMHFGEQDPLVLPLSAEGWGRQDRVNDVTPHLYRGKNTDGGYLAPIFSALSNGSPVFGPGVPPGHLNTISLEGDYGHDNPISIADQMSQSQRDVTAHQNTQEDIVSTLAKRRYALPPRAAAHAVAVAHDNMAAAGLVPGMGPVRTNASQVILDRLMGVPATPSAHSPNAGGNTAENAAVFPSQSYSISPLTPAGTRVPVAGSSSQQNAFVHQVPQQGDGAQATGRREGSREDPLQTSTGLDTESSRSQRTSSRLSTVKPLSGGLVADHEMSGVFPQIDAGMPAALAGTSSGVNAIAAVHKYRKMSQPQPGGKSNRPQSGVSFVGATTAQVDGSPAHFAASPGKRAQTESASFQNASFRYAPLYSNLDTSLSVVAKQPTVAPVPMPSFAPMEGGEDFPETSESGEESGTALTDSKIQPLEDGSSGDGGVYFSPTRAFPKRALGQSVDEEDDAPPYVLAARRTAAIAKKRQRRKERRVKPPFVLTAPFYQNCPVTGIPMAYGPSNDRIGTSRFVKPKSCAVPLPFRQVLPLHAHGVPPTPSQISGTIYAHPPNDTLVKLLRNVSLLSIPLTWLLEIRREEERYFSHETLKAATKLGMIPSEDLTSAAGNLSIRQKVTVLQNLPIPPFLSPKAIASEVLLDAPATHGLFASFERSGTLLELARFCRAYPDALHFLERVLEEADDTRSASNKAISFKKNSMAKDIIEGRERRRQRRMEKKGYIAPTQHDSADAESTSSANSSDNEDSDLEDLLLNNLGTNAAYQMDLVLPLFPQLDDMLTLLKASCETIKPDDSEEKRNEILAATATADRLISALDPALHAEPSLSWPFHVLCSFVCFFVTALKVGFVPLFKSLRKGSLVSSGKGLIASLAVSLACKECLAVDDISGFEPEPQDDQTSPPSKDSDSKPCYAPSDPFHYANRNSEVEGKFYSDESHKLHDVGLRKFLRTEAEFVLPTEDGDSNRKESPKKEDAGVSVSSIARRIHAVRVVRLRRYRQRLAEMGASPSHFCTLFPTTTEDGYFSNSIFTDMTSPPQRPRAGSNPITTPSSAGVPAPSFHTLAAVSDDYFTFEQSYPPKEGDSDEEIDAIIREANSYGANIPRGDMGKKQEADRRQQTKALQNERCEAIFFKHCVAALRAAQGVGLALESLRATSNIKPSTLIGADGSIIEPDESEEESIVRAAESGSDTSDDDYSKGNERSNKSDRRKNPTSPTQKKDTITNVNNKCSILVVNLDVIVLKILITAVNEGRTSWVGVESSNAAAAAAKKSGAHDDPQSQTDAFFGTLQRQAAALKAAENPNSATRGAATVVGYLEIARILCSRSSVVSGHPSDMARLDLMLIQYGAFSGEKIHRDTLPIEFPENHSFYCGDPLQTAILRIWKGVQHGYTYRADYNRLVAQRRKARAAERVRRRQERLEKRAKRRLLREQAMNARIGKTATSHSDFQSLMQQSDTDSSSSSETESDGADANYYADLAAMAAESPFEVPEDTEDSGAELNQDIYNFERATRFFLSFLVHPSELGIDLLHPCTGESMRRVRGGLTENSKNRSRKGPSSATEADDIALMYTNNDPSAQFRARFGGGYMNKARLKEAWSFMEALSSAIAAPRQNLNCSIDTIKQRNALRQRQSAAKHEDVDEGIYSANRQALYDGVLRETSKPLSSEGDGTLPSPISVKDSVAAAVLQSLSPPRAVNVPTHWDSQPRGETSNYSQATLSAARYGHPKDLLLDFSFSRLRVGQVLTWAHSSTAVGAFVTRNAMNSATNDVVCVPQPMDCVEQIGAVLKPPRRGTRGDVVSRTWLQLAIINRALASHVPQVPVSEKLFSKEVGSSKSPSVTAPGTGGATNDLGSRTKDAAATEVHRSVYDVADARLLQADGTPRIYSTTDSFIQFKILRPVFFHAVDATRAGEGDAVDASPKTTSPSEAAGSQNKSFRSTTGTTAGTALLNALNANAKIENDSHSCTSSSSESEGAKILRPMPPFMASSENKQTRLSSGSMGVSGKDALGSSYFDPNAAKLSSFSGGQTSSNSYHTGSTGYPSPLVDDPLTVNSHRDVAWLDDGFSMPLHRNGDVGHLLCFLEGMTGPEFYGSPSSTFEEAVGGPFSLKFLAGREGYTPGLPPSLTSPLLLSSFDIAISSSLPRAAGGIKPQHREKVRLARRALRGLILNATAFSGSTALGGQLQSTEEGGAQEQAPQHANSSHLSQQRSASNQVPIIDIGFGGRALRALEVGIDESPRIGLHNSDPRRRRGRRSAKVRGEGGRGRSQHTMQIPLIGTLLSESRYHSWAEVGHDFGDGAVARRRRAGLDLALDPSFALHLMNVERHQKLCLRRGLRFLARNKRMSEEYEAKYQHVKESDETAAIPAPPARPPFTEDELAREFSCHWLQAFINSDEDARESDTSRVSGQGDGARLGRLGGTLPANRTVPKVSIVEPFSVSSYDTLKKVCEYDAADALVAAGGGELLAFGRTAASEGQYGRMMRKRPSSEKDPVALPPPLIEYLRGLFNLYIGDPNCEMAREVLNLVGTIGHCAGAEASGNCSTAAPPFSTINPKSPLSIQTPPMLSPERRPERALSLLAKAPPVTVMPIGGSGRSGEGVDLDGLERSRSRANSRAASPSMLRNLADVMMRSKSTRSRTSSAGPAPENTAERQKASGGGDGQCVCSFCGKAMANAISLRMHESYCQPEGSVVTPRAALATSPPFVAQQGSPGTSNLVPTRQSSLLNIVTSHRRPSPLTTPVAASSTGGLDRHVFPSAGLQIAASRSVSVGSQRPTQQSSQMTTTGNVERTLSSSSHHSSGMRAELDGGAAIDQQQSVTLVDLTGDQRQVSQVRHRPSSSSLSGARSEQLAPFQPSLPHPMNTPYDANQSLAAAGLTPHGGTSPSTMRTPMSEDNLGGGTQLNARSETVVRVQQAAVLHALLMNTRGRPAGSRCIKIDDGAAVVSQGDAADTPNSTDFQGQESNKSSTGLSPLEKGLHLEHEDSRQAESTATQAEPIAVIDVASANTVRGSSSSEDAIEVLGGYQFLIANPTLKNEADAVVLDLLQFIASLRSSLLVQKEQLYQQVIVAYHHLEQLRAITTSARSITLPPSTGQQRHQGQVTSPLGHSTESLQSPISPVDVTARLEGLKANPYVSIVILTHHIRQLMAAIEGCKRRREVLRQVSSNYHRVKTGVMLTPQGLQFTENLRKLTDLPFPRFTLLMCPTVLQLLDFWDALEFTTFYCGC